MLRKMCIEVVRSIYGVVAHGELLLFYGLRFRDMELHALRGLGIFIPKNRVLVLSFGEKLR